VLVGLAFRHQAGRSAHESCAKEGDSVRVLLGPCLLCKTVKERTDNTKVTWTWDYWASVCYKPESGSGWFHYEKKDFKILEGIKYVK
jgi:hypothetical protein